MLVSRQTNIEKDNIFGLSYVESNPNKIHLWCPPGFSAWQHMFIMYTTLNSVLSKSKDIKHHLYADDNHSQLLQHSIYLHYLISVSSMKTLTFRLVSTTGIISRTSPANPSSSFTGYIFLTATAPASAPNCGLNRGSVVASRGRSITSGARFEPSQFAAIDG